MDALAPVTGSPTRWGRDFALIGGLSGLFGPGIAALMSPSFAIVAALVGALIGAVLGLGLADGLERVRGRVPLWAIALAALPIGAAWGGIVGLLAGLVFGPEAALIGGLLAAFAGAVQLGWLWLPYTVLAVLRRPTWPLVVLAGVVAPLPGLLGLILLGLL